jgi:uroporphyrinogen decarboxylase
LPEYHTPGPPGSARPDFFERCTNAGIAAQITLQPLVRFPIDAAIIFSDILIVPQAMGRSLKMVPSEGPVFDVPLEPTDTFPAADDPAVHAKLQSIMRALTVTRHRLNGHAPLIGFAGGPWTLLAYMVEGAPSKTWSRARSWLYQHERRVHEILHLLTRVLILYLVNQVRAGAQVLQVRRNVVLGRRGGCVLDRAECRCLKVTPAS